MKWMCLVWAAALLMGLGIVKLMDGTAAPEPEPTAVVEEEHNGQ